MTVWIKSENWERSFHVLQAKYMNIHNNIYIENDFWRSMTYHTQIIQIKKPTKSDHLYTRIWVEKVRPTIFLKRLPLFKINHDKGILWYKISLIVVILIKRWTKLTNFKWNIKLSYKWFVLCWLKTKKSFVSQNYLVSIASLSGQSNGLCWIN